MKTVIILRGLPGSGKSMIASLMNKPVVCSADHFFEKDDEYNFNARLLGAAHSSCMTKFKAAIGSGEELIVVDNTNTTRKEYKDYLKAGEQAGYIVSIVTVGGIDEDAIEKCIERNSHGVPAETIIKMAKRFSR